MDAETLIARLQPLPAQARAMFGGRGLYLEGRFFGLVYDGKVYFRTDAGSRGDYIARGMTAFQPPDRPRGPRTVGRNFEVPRDVLEDASLLQAWALRAAEAYGREPSRGR
jgi:DNA transformation protein